MTVQHQACFGGRWLLRLRLGGPDARQRVLGPVRQIVGFRADRAGLIPFRLIGVWWPPRAARRLFGCAGVIQTRPRDRLRPLMGSSEYHHWRAPDSGCLAGVAE